MSRADEIPDIDNAKEGGNPKICVGCFEVTIIDMGTFMSADVPGKMKPTPMYYTNFTVDEIISQAAAIQASERDDNPPQPVLTLGEVRKWQCNMAQPKNGVRMRDLTQALLRFEPGSKLAETAVDKTGKAVSWRDILNEGIAQDNPFGGKHARVTVQRIITDRGQGHAMYVPTWLVSSRVKVRDSHIVTGF